MKKRQRGFIVDPFRFAVAGTLNPTLSNVVFALHGDALPWYDVGNAPHGIANYGATIDTGTKPSFATGSLAIPNSASGVRVASGASSTDFKFGTGSWFMEAQVYTDGIARIFDTRSASGQPGWVFFSSATRELSFQDDGVVYASATNQITPSVWQHIAASYDGTTLRLFVNGAIVHSVVVALNIDTGQHLAIANLNDMSAGNLAQKTAELRIVKGEAVATSAFAAPTAKFTDSGNVRSLQTNVTYSNVLLRSTYDANVNDVSTYARTMTANGGAAVSSAQSKFGGSSLLLDGTGDYLSTPDAADLDLGTGDYQFQVWARRSGSAIDKTILSCYVNATSGYAMAVTTGQIPYWNETGDGIDGTFVDALADLTWEHVAVSRKDAVLYTFVNGVLQRFIDSTQTVNCTGTMFVGRLNNTYPSYDWPGNLDDLQLVKAECQLFKSFLVPTAALPVS